METLARICLHEPRGVREIDPSLPPELAELTHRLLSKAPADRPQTTAEVVAALERIERSAALDRTRQHPLADPVLAAEPTTLDVRRSAPPRSATRRRSPAANAGR